MKNSKNDKNGQKQSGETLDFIQAMRGLAALGVTLWHASRYLTPNGTYSVGISGQFFMPLASWGVDLFFIVSGFIMVYTTRRNDGTVAYLWNFAVKRFVRIVPLWFLGVFIVGVLLNNDYESISDGRLLRSLLFIPISGNEAPPVFGYPVLSVGWTLNYEVYFYGFFGISMLLGRKLRWLGFSLWVLLTLIAIPLVFGNVDSLRRIFSPSSSHGFQTAYLCLVTNPIIFLFIIGVIISLVYQSSFRITNPIVARVLLLVVISFTIWQYLYHFKIRHGIFDWGLSLIPLFFIVAITSKTLQFHIPRWLVYLGDISYSLYLFHPMAQGGLDTIMRSLGYKDPQTGLVSFFGSTALAIVIAAFTHRYIEKKFCGYIKNKLLKN